MREPAFNAFKRRTQSRLANPELKTRSTKRANTGAAISRTVVRPGPLPVQIAMPMVPSNGRVHYLCLRLRHESSAEEMNVFYERCNEPIVNFLIDSLPFDESIEEPLLTSIQSTFQWSVVGTEYLLIRFCVKCTCFDDKAIVAFMSPLVIDVKARYYIVICTKLLVIVNQ